MKQIVKRWMAGILAVVALSGGLVWYRTVALGKAFAWIQRGDSSERVVALFRQRPEVTTNVETNINWNDVWVDNTNSVRCVRQFHFNPPFSISGESWVVGFDERSNVVAKYHIVSP
ncbi:MAG TPA: hypothetical protein VGJ73_19940 [Verrucomicrobiae bacterium]|jgi:hypothetical protein